jgi:hypothetical protein
MEPGLNIARDKRWNRALTLREGLAEDRLDDFVRQEEDRSVELASGSELERALARLEAQSGRSTSRGGE